MNALNFSTQSAVDDNPNCAFTFASLKRPVAGVVKSIKRHKLIFFENNEPPYCRRPSSSTSRNRGHKS
jgi:hypothetical protein